MNAVDLVALVGLSCCAFGASTAPIAKASVRQIRKRTEKRRTPTWLRDRSLERLLGHPHVVIVRQTVEMGKAQGKRVRHRTTPDERSPPRKVLLALETHLRQRPGTLDVRWEVVGGKLALKVHRREGDRQWIDWIHAIDRTPETPQLADAQGKLVHPKLQGKSFNIAAVLAEWFEGSLDEPLPLERIAKVQSRILERRFDPPPDLGTYYRTRIARTRPLLRYIAELYGFTPAALEEHMLAMLPFLAVFDDHFALGVDTSPRVVKAKYKPGFNPFPGGRSAYDFVEFPGGRRSLPSVIGFDIAMTSAGTQLQAGHIRLAPEAWRMLARFAPRAFDHLAFLTQRTLHDVSSHMVYPTVLPETLDTYELRAILAHRYATRAWMKDNPSLRDQTFEEALAFASEVERATAAYIEAHERSTGPSRRVRARARRLRDHLMHLLLVENLLWIFRPDELPEPLRAIYAELPQLGKSNSHRYQQRILEAERNGTVFGAATFADVRTALEQELQNRLQGPPDETMPSAAELTQIAKSAGAPPGPSMTPLEEATVAAWLARLLRGPGSVSYRSFAERVRQSTEEIGPQPFAPMSPFATHAEDPMLVVAAAGAAFDGKATVDHALPLARMARQGALVELPASLVGGGRRDGSVYAVSFGYRHPHLILFVPRLGRTIAVRPGQLVAALFESPLAGRTILFSPGTLSRRGAPKLRKRLRHVEVIR